MSTGDVHGRGAIRALLRFVPQAGDVRVVSLLVGSISWRSVACSRRPGGDLRPFLVFDKFLLVAEVMKGHSGLLAVNES